MGLWSYVKRFFSKKTRPVKTSTFTTTKESIKSKPKKAEFAIPEISEYKEEVKKPVTKPTKKDYGFKKLRTSDSYEKGISSTGPNTYSFTHNKESPSKSVNDEYFTTKYGTLLSGKVNDNKLFNDLIKYKDILLKKRINMKVQVEGKTSNEKGIFEVIGILPEGEELIRQFFIGRVVESGNWQVTLNDFKSHMDTLGTPVIAVNSIFGPQTRMTILNIYGKVVFK